MEDIKAKTKNKNHFLVLYCYIDIFSSLINTAINISFVRFEPWVCLRIIISKTTPASLMLSINLKNMYVILLRPI